MPQHPNPRPRLIGPIIALATLVLTAGIASPAVAGNGDAEPANLIMLILPLAALVLLAFIELWRQSVAAFRPARRGRARRWTPGDGEG